MAESSPLRTCIVTSEEKSKEEMIRFVTDPAGHVVPDIAGKLPGRGVWVTATREAVIEAARKNLFARSLKQKTTAEEALAEQTSMLLKKRVLDLLSLANKSGVLVSGFSKSMEALTSRKAALWFDAVDGGNADFEKLSRLPHGISPSRDFSRIELGRPVGRPDAVHVVVMTSGIAGEILKEMRRFAGFRKIDTL